MKPIHFKSTNNAAERVTFETGLLRGLAPDYGLYMIDRADIPVLDPLVIASMKNMSYSESLSRFFHLISFGDRGERIDGDSR